MYETDVLNLKCDDCGTTKDVVLFNPIVQREKYTDEIKKIVYKNMRCANPKCKSHRIMNYCNICGKISLEFDPHRAETYCKKCGTVF